MNRVTIRNWSNYINIRTLDSKTKNITRNKKKHFIVIKRSICHKDIIALTVYSPNNTHSK